MTIASFHFYHNVPLVGATAPLRWHEDIGLHCGIALEPNGLQYEFDHFYVFSPLVLHPIEKIACSSNLSLTKFTEKGIVLIENKEKLYEEECPTFSFSGCLFLLISVIEILCILRYFWSFDLKADE